MTAKTTKPYETLAQQHERHARSGRRLYIIIWVLTIAFAVVMLAFAAQA